MIHAEASFKILQLLPHCSLEMIPYLSITIYGPSQQPLIYGTFFFSARENKPDPALQMLYQRAAASATRDQLHTTPHPRQQRRVKSAAPAYRGTASTQPPPPPPASISYGPDTWTENWVGGGQQRSRPQTAATERQRAELASRKSDRSELSAEKPFR